MYTQQPAPTEDPGAPQRTDVRAALLGGTTFRSLSEQTLSPREEKFERTRQTIGLFLAPVVAVVFALLPLNLERQQHLLAAVLLGVIILWICEPVPIPIGGLIGVAAIVILGVAPASAVLAPFGSTTIFTFIGAFILAQAMLKHGIAQRLAFAVLSMPGVGKSTYRVVIAFGVITCMLSAFVSNTATVAMLMPTALGVLVVIAQLMQDRGVVKTDFDPLRLRIGAALLLMLAYGASVGGLLTPVGSPPNLIGRGLIEEATGVRISFAQWMAIAAPVCLAMFVVLALVMLLLNKPEIRRLEGVEEYVREQREAQGKMSRAEVNTLIAFGVTVTLWLAPAVASLIGGTESEAYIFLDDRLDEGIVAVLGASLLFILPVNWKQRQATLTWSDAAKIDWGTILLFGTGIIFGALLAETGLAETIGKGASENLNITNVVAITVFSAVLAIIISETTSNTASAAVIVPIVIPLCQAIGVDPFVPALAATFAASFGFMLPVSTPQNAIVYGTGAVPITRMIRTGLFFDVLGAILIITIVPVMIAVVGIGG
ncbi:DASS family sodium-coupled anion symporter [Arthrobacter sp. zg-Y820]|uniref:SLC13 family permease n=1 Tax=unclassified Arthrobacter TaxID=235627 RepID=UPI0025402CC5|nr:MULTISPECIES: DASS family sodium-coupled anion symporter [unclassified Arthrobacter]MCC9196727.1 DASS family sodium-coupled anion symporter [Arthrobacter sp. zg-Y820]MDK1279589.1 DASS family sodium-coupled anion symporter [Arthrobacter sp. zg.Y820]MDK1358790.1 DASS family sodium-coupled anion symporter [Arthrobacter sp. zg-Y1219]WIB08039.1 DASS family sodium-coupled anion symporter [Arthrobacter sp. zg-Y820]